MYLSRAPEEVGYPLCIVLCFKP